MEQYEREHRIVKLNASRAMLLQVERWLERRVRLEVWEEIRRIEKEVFELGGELWERNKRSTIIINFERENQYTMRYWGRHITSKTSTHTVIQGRA
jgi:hypothetical protein